MAGRASALALLSADPLPTMVARKERRGVVDLPISGMVLGVDPGSRAMGWGVVSQSRGELQRIAGGVLKPPKGELAERLGWLLAQLSQIFERFEVENLAVESAFVHTNPRTALVLGQARGLPIALAAARKIPVYEYAPARVKRQVVGRGRATKQQVRLMIAAQLGLAAQPSEDEADALAVAVTHCRLARVGHASKQATKTRAQLQYEAALRAARRKRSRR